jgi:hypothetical protein
MTITSLAVLVLLVAAVSPKKYDVVKYVNIDTSSKFVFDYIKYIKNQDNFSVWAEMDPNTQKTYTGVDGTVGFVSAWKSNNKDVGQGEQEIKNIIPGKRVDFELRFNEPFQSTGQAYITTEAISESETKAVWGFYGSMPYPMNIMLLFMDMDEMLGSDLETGLENLKQLLESNLVNLQFSDGC